MARPSRRTLLASLGLAALAAGVASCTSPTLPLPPPTLPTISEGSSPGLVALSSTSGVQPSALVIVVNKNESLPREKRVAGTFADDTGSWRLEITASPGDVLDVTQDVDGARSPPTTLSVR